jgi:hypothetical protein
MHAKYNAVLVPIARQVLPEDEADRINFETFFHFVLFHEMAHGLGPGKIVVDGRETEVRLELKELSSALEEAKADVVGAYSLYQLADKGVVANELIALLPWTYTAGLFRSARFGTVEAHGLGVVLQTNFLLEQGAIVMTADGRFKPVAEQFPVALRELAAKILMIQALGSYDQARSLIEQYGTPSEQMLSTLDSFVGIPGDIDPVYPLEGLQE